MANKSMNSISFKALVDKRSNKVIFIETDNDFVDVLFSFLTTPMGTIIRLARKHSLPVETGCMNNLYASVENIDARNFQTGACKDMLLYPRSGAELHCKNLQLKINNDEPTQYFLCSKDCTFIYNLFSHYKDVLCECGEPMDNEIPLSVGKLKKSSSADGGVFCKGLTRFIITDDLEVMPPSSSVICSLFTKLKVMDASTTEELAFNVGVGEVLEMLVCSLVSKMPLSETLLKLKSQPNMSNEYPNQGICIEPQTVGGFMYKEDTISVKLIICKSQKIVCYAEAGEDFVNLLFSFLTIPLGFIIKQIQDRSSSLKGSIEQLYKSVQDLDDEFFKSNYQKEILLNPKLYPGFCYENRLLGIEYGLETSNYWIDDSLSEVLTTDKDSIPSYTSYTTPVTTVPLKLKYCGTQYDAVRDQGFLNGPTMFTITDNLIIRPISPLFALSVLNKMKVPFTDIEEQIVQVGKEEAFRLLVTSFLSDSSLTSVFLRQPKSKFKQ